jgi:Glycosyl transferase family 2
MSPTVSVVVTNYNYGRYVGEAVRSADGADEVIVVDDGSTDGSQDVIKALAARSILKPNGGHVSAVNTGFAASRGDIVIFLDADDRLGPGCIDAIRKNWTPSVAKLQWGLRQIDADGNVRPVTWPVFTAHHTPQWCRDQMVRQCFYTTPSTSGNAWSRSFLEQVMPLPQLGSPIWELDNYLHMLAPYFGDVVSLVDVVGDYRVHTGQMSGTGTFALQRHELHTGDQRLCFEAVNNVLARHGHPRLDELRWSQHTVNRLFLIRLGLSRESIWPLLPRHVMAVLRQDSGIISKAKNIILGGLLMLPSRSLVRRLALMKYAKG